MLVGKIDWLKCPQAYIFQVIKMLGVVYASFFVILHGNGNYDTFFKVGAALFCNESMFACT